VEKPIHRDTWWVRESAAEVELARLPDISNLLELHQSSAEARLLYIAAVVRAHDGTVGDTLGYMTVKMQLGHHHVWSRDAPAECVRIHWKNCYVPGHGSVLEVVGSKQSLRSGNHATLEAVRRLAVEAAMVSLGPNLDQSQCLRRTCAKILLGLPQPSC
jgi:hypothetical protein